jgi:uncharacterized protein (UPF0332 family)
MINQSDRHALVKYRLDQAKDSIELVRFLIDSKKLPVAVNRIYYGIYYSITALSIANKFETSKHAQLIGWFNKEFIATEILNKKFGRILRNAYQNRNKGDYDAFAEFKMDEVELMYSEMIEFIGEIIKILNLK